MKSKYSQPCHVVDNCFSILPKEYKEVVDVCTSCLYVVSTQIKTQYNKQCGVGEGKSCQNGVLPEEMERAKYRNYSVCK